MVSYSKASFILSSALSTGANVASAHELPKGFEIENFSAKLKTLRLGQGKGVGASSKAAKGDGRASGNGKPSAVYTMTNQPNNEVIIHARDDATGLLTYAGTASTRGDGGAIGLSVDPTVSSDGIIVAGECLLVCNAGSGDVSAFRILDSNSISFSDKVSSGGASPLSIAHNPDTDTVYILNAVGGASGSGSIQAVNLDQRQCDFDYPLDPVIIDQGGDVVLAAPSAPKQVGITPEGNLLVTIGALGGAGVLFGAVPNPPTAVYEYPLNDDGSIVPTAAVTTDTTGGPAPLGSTHTGFDFDSFGRLLIADAFRFGGFPPAPEGCPACAPSGVSVLEPNGDGTYTASQDPIRLQDTFACWLKYHPRNNCLVTANTSTFGTLTMLRSTESGVEVVQDPAAEDLHAPLDLNFSDDGRFIYVLGPEDTNDDCNAPGCGSGLPQIFVFEVDEECGITLVQNMADGFPSIAEKEVTAPYIGTYGLAVYN